MIAGTSARVDDAERAAVLLEPAERLPIASRPALPSSVNAVEIDLRLLAELDERQAEVGVVMQVRRVTS